MHDIPDRSLPAGVWLEVKPPQTPASVYLEIEPLLIELGLNELVCLETRSVLGQPHLCISLHADVFRAICPNFDTLNILGQSNLNGCVGVDPLAREIYISLMAAPMGLRFGSVRSLQSHVRIRINIARAASKTSLAFKTEAAERPMDYWSEHPENGFVLRPKVNLVEALVAATQPDHTGRVYDFSCYRASEYIVLLGIAQEAQRINPGYFLQLEEQCREKVIRSGAFHDTYLIEYGSLEQPIPKRYYVPGDRVWFKNPDSYSSDVVGYEGSWLFYMGAGQFSNFWRREHPYDLETKCLEIFHWRDGVSRSDGGLEMNEDIVEHHMQQTSANPERRELVLSQMMSYRDPMGVYAQGGCIDISREYARAIVS